MVSRTASGNAVEDSDVMVCKQYSGFSPGQAQFLGLVESSSPVSEAGDSVQGLVTDVRGFHNPHKEF